MHVLFDDQFDKKPDADFFDAYFGKVVLEELARAPVRFPTWPMEARRTLRALCELFATQIPEADHVVRRDVNTGCHAPSAINGELLMYFGIQMEPAGRRGQFTGVTYRHHQGRVELYVFVAGTTDDNEAQRRALISSEDPEGHLNGRLLTKVDDVVKLRADAARVLAIQRQVILQKKSTPGFCPVTGQLRWGKKKRLDEETAGKLLFAFWRIHRDGVPADQARREEALLAERNGFRKAAAISLIRDHIAVEDAFRLALRLRV